MVLVSESFFAEYFFATIELVHLNNNRLKTITANAFKNVSHLIELHLESNQLADLSPKSFFNLSQLTTLYLNANKFTHFSAITSALKHLVNLKRIDLSNNLLTEVDETAFDFSPALESISLSDNLIRNVAELAFTRLTHLRAFYFARNQLPTFNLKCLNLANIVELDLSFNTLSLNDSRLANLEVIALENAYSNVTFEVFMTPKLRTVDFSSVDLSADSFKMFDSLASIESLKLRRVGHLYSMSQINFANFGCLKHLDLSYNNLTALNQDSFANLVNLEHLDLSHNQIAIFDSAIFAKYTQAQANPLKYLNLENNRVTI